MKNLLFIIAFIFGTIFTAAAQTNSNHTYVNGYTKSNGTYVQGYYRTAPNNTINDNFSTYPNVNPYTGTTGTVSPTYSNSTYSNSSYSKNYNSNSYTNSSNYSNYYNTPSIYYPKTY